MSKVVRVHNGDYKVIVGSINSINNIELDASPFPNYSSTRLYYIGDVVKFNNTLYKARSNLPSVGIQPTNGTYWSVTQSGKIIVNGDLEVLGNTTTIESETLTIKDNIIYLNVGEQGNGVSTLGVTAGIQIDRGTQPNVAVLWDERLDTFAFVNSADYNVSGTPTPSELASAIQAIAVKEINSGSGNLSLKIEGSGVVRVTGTDSDGIVYSSKVLNNSIIDTILDISFISRSGTTATIVTSTPHGLSENDYVDITCISNNSFSENFALVQAVTASNVFTYINPGLAILPAVPASGTVRPNPIYNFNTIPNMRAVADYVRASAKFFVPTKIQELDTKVEVKDFDVSGVSEISFDVNGTEKALINDGGLFVGNINIYNNNIANIANDNILFDSVLSIPNKTAVPSTPTSHVKLYSKVLPGTGGTGLYFVNTIGTNDELISKTKALLYSLIL
jgi:hypothetical protein